MNGRKLFAAVAAMLLCALVQPSYAQKLALSTGTLAPYTTKDHRGFLDQVIGELFSRVGRDAEVVVYKASARALDLANKGIDDGAAMRIRGLERKYPNLIRVSEILLRNDFVAISRDRIFATEGWASLAPHNIAYILGWRIYARNLADHPAAIQVRNADQLFRVFENGRVDVVLYERWQGLWRARNRGLRARVLEPPLAASDMFVYLHKKHRAMVEQVAAALVAMKRDGSYQRIFDRTLTPLAKELFLP